MDSQLTIMISSQQEQRDIGFLRRKLLIMEKRREARKRQVNNNEISMINMYYGK